MVSDNELLLVRSSSEAAFQSALRFAVVSDGVVRTGRLRGGVSIRFEVRGGFRRQKGTLCLKKRVSIRFEVRGGFRPGQWYLVPVAIFVSIRFEVRGGFRRVAKAVTPLRKGFNPL